MTAVRRSLIGLWVGLTLGTGFGGAVEVHIIGGLTRESKANPGEQIEGKILVSNTATQPRNVKVYQTDYRYSADGSSEYGEPGTVARSNAAWIAFTPQQLEIPPEETATVFYTLRVPDSPDLRGTYWSMLMIEPLGEESPEVVGPDGETEPRVSIRTVMRYGIQMITDVGSGAQPEARFGAMKLVVDGDQRTFLVDVENAGESRMDPVVWAELYGADGVSIGRFDSTRARVLPACSVRFDIDLTGVPADTYTALIVADNGDDNVVGTQAKLEVK